MRDRKIGKENWGKEDGFIFFSSKRKKVRQWLTTPELDETDRLEMDQLVGSFHSGHPTFSAQFQPYFHPVNVFKHVGLGLDGPLLQEQIGYVRNTDDQVVALAFEL